ncbi:MAG: hypothetical protein H6620_06175 [Halobacteriovoraceae bacterium]|nr:hypothetical protein [Halobacteriovoraceae bacterium]
MKRLTVLLMFLSVSAVKSQEKIIYKYEKHQKVDLGDLQIKGKVLAPGDITISERERKRFRRELYDRREWDQEVRIDILNMR